MNHIYKLIFSQNYDHVENLELMRKELRPDFNMHNSEMYINQIDSFQNFKNSLAAILTHQDLITYQFS